MRLSRRQQIDKWRRYFRAEMRAELERRERKEALRKLGRHLDQARTARNIG